ncbi:putative NBD/HSP70 family sugar kinase [Streptococcus rupicaprae]|uniref:NBD/HSP70 family sugar kinase n=1 Tax=Streptococcus rupicaprae TaxID=759619 RepID=A0ABV2FGG3_9STRE
MSKYVAIDIGGTQIKYGLIDETGTILEDYKIDTEAHLGGPAILDKVGQIVGTYQAEHELIGVGISSAGMIDPDKGEIFYAGPQIPNYAGTNFKATIELEFGLPCEAENDVNCAGLAESQVGATRGASVAVCLTIGTGIGGSLLLDGKVFHGFSNSACEVGYIHLPDGAFQDLASTTALVTEVAKQVDEPVSNWSGLRIFDEAKSGNDVCLAAIDRMVDYLGQGIANICYVTNPEIVVLGGGIMAQREFLEERIKAALKRHLVSSIADKTRIVFAQNENVAGMLGAYYHFRQKQRVGQKSVIR